MGCSHIPLLPYTSFSETLHNKALAGRIPVNGTIEVTFRCNLKCPHCYCALDPAKKELSFRDIRRIIDETVEAGCLWLLITGGEPLLRSDFFDIYDHAKKRGLITSLFTNGTLITPEVADHLKALRPFVVEITLYGATEETYERVTGVPGSFERCMRGIELLRRHAIPLKLKTVVSTLNRHEVRQMKRYAKALGVEFRHDPLINPRIDGSKEPCDLRISPEEAVQLDIDDTDRAKGWRDFLDGYDKRRPDHLFTCGAGLHSFIVNPYGELQLCGLFRRPGYDLVRGAFREGWDSFFPKLRELKFGSDNKCWRCRDFAVCDQCPGWGQAEKDDPGSPADYVCAIARLRAKAFLKKEGGMYEAKIPETAH